MKYKVIKTGEIVNVVTYDYDENKEEYLFINLDGTTIYREHELELLDNKKKSNINWEQRRFELVKATLPVTMSIRWNERYIKLEDIVNTAFAYADSVIEKLKEE